MRSLVNSFNNFLRSETASSIVLSISLLMALVFANWSFTAEFYQNSLGTKVGGLSIQHWINDALMAVFFYLVGMEIKKELVTGALSSQKKAMLPLFAAIGGMVLPALFFSILNQEQEAAKAWGIPMATDIAFAVGVIVALGNRIPVALRALLLAIAVIDDLGAIIVIAFFYSKGVAPLWLVGFLAAAFLNWVLNKKGKWSWSIHIFLGLIAWGCMLLSGVHATLAGVIWGLLTPDDKSDHAPLDIATHKLHPYVSFGTLPLFALANSGLKLPSTSDLFATLNDSLLWAIGIGLLVGKPIGIALSSWICIKSKMGVLPIGVSFRHIWGIGFLAGIGFTMSLFIAQLSLPKEELLNSAKIGILAGSIFAGLFGFTLLRFSGERIGNG